MSYYINEKFPFKKELTKVLNNLNFNELDSLSKNTRNSIYEIQPEWLDQTIIIKRSKPNPNYRLSRKISFYLRNLFKHYGRRGFKGAKAIQDQNILSVDPIAYWKHKVGFCVYQSCFAYYKVDADFALNDFIERKFEIENINHQAFLVDAIQGAARISRELHDANLVHGDMVLNNFLIKLKKDLSEFDIILIDTDHVGKNFLPGKFLKTFYALKCFRRMKNNLITETFLKAYFETEKVSQIWIKTVNFWRWYDRRPFSRFVKKISKTSIPEKEKQENVKRPMPLLQDSMQYLKSKN